LSGDKYTVPRNLHWNIRQNNTMETVQVAMSPADLLEFDEVGGSLVFNYGTAITAPNGAVVGEAGVEIVGPSTLLEKISVRGVSDTVAIQSTSSSQFTVDVAGVGHVITVSAPGPVRLNANGVDCSVTIESETSATVSVSVEGVNQSIKVAAPSVAGSVQGVDNLMAVKAETLSLQVKGVGNAAIVDSDSGCSGVSTDGVDILCSEGNVTVSGAGEASCLSDGSTSNQNCGKSGSSHTPSSFLGLFVASVLLLHILNLE